MQPKTISEQLMFNTVKLVASDGSSGTGFFFDFDIDGKTYPTLITNKHVVRYNPNEAMTFFLHLETGNNSSEENHQVTYQTNWIFHSKQDLCFCFINPVLEEVKKRYWDARHHCWAYVIGQNPASERMSDDGEPAGTAGKPILEVIRGRGLTNVFVVVTRYFGGTLLGTGGLVRAYTAAAAEGIAQSTVVTKIYGYKLKITTDYTGLGKIQYILGKRGIHVLDTVYTDRVRIFAFVSGDEEAALKKDIMEGTNGQAMIERVEECWHSEESS